MPPRGGRLDEFAGIDGAATLMLRATRTRKPARSISISVRLVSSSSRASSRISALSSLLDFAAVCRQAGAP
jgi:hypothetical protein